MPDDAEPRFLTGPALTRASAIIRSYPPIGWNCDRAVTSVLSRIATNWSLSCYAQTTSESLCIRCVCKIPMKVLKLVEIWATVTEW